MVLDPSVVGDGRPRLDDCFFLVLMRVYAIPGTLDNFGF